MILEMAIGCAQLVMHQITVTIEMRRSFHGQQAVNRRF